MGVMSKIRTMRNAISQLGAQRVQWERIQILQGKTLAGNNARRDDVRELREVEFSVFSQWGDDGIIQFLVDRLHLTCRTFVEFGVADYRGSNTRFLMINNNWRGLVMDGSTANIRAITQAEYFWRYELVAQHAFIDCDNVNDLISEQGFTGEIGLLHIDIDGNDYWVWKAITVIEPAIVIMEYNSVFGPERAITVPYRRDFDRTRAHFSTLYAGASLSALQGLASEKGYVFLGCNSAGNNAYFIQKRRMTDELMALANQFKWEASKFRESRDLEGNPSLIGGAGRLKMIRGLPVFNTKTGGCEKL